MILWLTTFIIVEVLCLCFSNSSEFDSKFKIYQRNEVKSPHTSVFVLQPPRFLLSSGAIMVNVFLVYLFRDSGVDKNNMPILFTPIYTNGAYHIILLLIFFPISISWRSFHFSA